MKIVQVNKVTGFALLIILINSWSLSGQEKVFVYFDSESSEMCNIPSSQQGRYHGDKIVRKFKKISSSDSSDDVEFLICNELFLFNSENKKQILDLQDLRNIKFSEIEDLINIANNTSPLYPNKAFDKIYLVEKIDERKVALYDVKWQYYLE